ncbi:MAG: glycine cleavage system protein GcvH [Clostridia bacterium]|nr:glycine cleavage system protein GcvH [Clostridia bacterium]
MKYPKDLKYNEEHLWVKVERDEALIGITDYAQSKLGEILFVEMPDVGDELRINDELSVVESSKKASTILSPVSGEILEINERLDDEPEYINGAPYDAWIVRIGLNNKSELNDLFDAEQYKDILG